MMKRVLLFVSVAASVLATSGCGGPKDEPLPASATQGGNSKPLSSLPGGGMASPVGGGTAAPAQGAGGATQSQ